MGDYPIKKVVLCEKDFGILVGGSDEPGLRPHI
jgi:hypothetical protein